MKRDWRIRKSGFEIAKKEERRKEKVCNMITKFEKQAVALLLAVAMCFAAVLSCGEAAYATEANPAAETRTGETVAASEETLVASSEKASTVTSEETPGVPSGETSGAESGETSGAESDGESAGVPVTTSEEALAGEPEKADNAVAEGAVADNGQKAARAATATEGDYEYTVLKDDSAVVSKYNGTETEVSIPGTLGGKSVSSIGESAFEHNRAIEKVKLPATVTSIQYLAFYDCINLKNVELSGNNLKTIEDRAFFSSGLTEFIALSVERVGEEAFWNCGDLESVVFGAQLKSLGRCAFSGCQNLASVTIGNSVTVVGARAFEGCALTTVTIGNQVETIDSFTFAGNRKLNKVVIPQNVTRLEYAVFENCETLADITFPDTLTKIEGHVLDGTAWYAGQANGSVYAGKVLYHYKGDMPTETSVKIQDGTKGIAAFAFYECKNLKEIEISEGVTNIGRFAFYDAGPMSSVRIPASVTEIGRKALGYFESQNGTSFYDGVDDVNEAGSEVGCYEKIPGFTIYGRTGSAAQKYAGENGFIFVAEDPRLEIVLDVTDKAYLIGSGSNAVIKCTGELKDFVSVAVDGQLVDPSCYILAEGSTVLTFLSFYLDTLSVGDHVVTLNYTYGSIDTIVTILDRDTDNVENMNQNGNAGSEGNANNASGNANKNTANGIPKTGDTALSYVMCLLFLASGIGILVFVVKRKNGIKI